MKTMRMPLVPNDYHGKNTSNNQPMTSTYSICSCYHGEYNSIHVTTVHS